MRHDSEFRHDRHTPSARRGQTSTSTETGEPSDRPSIMNLGTLEFPDSRLRACLDRVVQVPPPDGPPWKNHQNEHDANRD